MQPKIYLPLAKLEECAVCHSKKSPRLCAACNERTYCSPKCQKDDWPDHKPVCGKTDKLGLDKFYPFIACMAGAAHMHNAKPAHPALRRVIVNRPNPGTRPVGFPDGSAANLVILGEPLRDQSEMGSATWWPGALTDKVRSKFFRRIANEGGTLPILTAVCLALLSEIYTTTAEGKTRRRTRLAYKSSPIADFGIAAGSAKVTSQDRLAYLIGGDGDTDPEAGMFFGGQDPNDHYWLYFTTIRGETVTLDCGMFTWNNCIAVDAAPYSTNVKGLPPMGLGWMPAFWREREMDGSTPEMYTERIRASVLRNQQLQDVVETAGPEGHESRHVGIVSRFMQGLARREMSQEELGFAFAILYQNEAALRDVVATRRWEQWPDSPQMGIEMDPQEVAENALDDDEAWAKYLRKFKKAKKAGADREELNEAFKKWQRKQETKRRQ
ncbi:MYND-type domain-containing protein [Mycena kentingensis (nom. inval.)]|nr:MYND-type domain-containing protein [Mycena kentingensis (nom. inval.)]